LPALVWVHFEDLKDENVKTRQDSHVNEAVGKGSEEKKGKKMEGNFFGCFLVVFWKKKNQHQPHKNTLPPAHGPIRWRGEKICAV